MHMLYYVGIHTQAFTGIIEEEHLQAKKCAPLAHSGQKLLGRKKRWTRLKARCVFVFDHSFQLPE